MMRTVSLLQLWGFLLEGPTAALEERVHDTEVVATIVEGHAAFDATGRLDSDVAHVAAR